MQRFPGLGAPPPWPSAVDWQPRRADRGSSRAIISIGIGVFAFVITAGAVFVAMRTQAAAGSACHIYDAPERFGMIGVIIVSSLVSASISCFLAVLASRLHPLAGVIVAIGVAALLAYFCLADTGPMIRDYWGPAGFPTCPDGLPSWWPSWAPR